MKILIYGGGGLIGQEIAKLHIQEGDEVYIYDTQVNPYNDYSRLRGIVLPFPPTPDLINDVDIISYQAAHVGVGESMYKPWKYMDNNVGDLAMLIETLIDNDIKKPIVFAGSMGPYGEGHYSCPWCGDTVYPVERECPACGKPLSELKSLPLYEGDAFSPVSFYGLSKAAQEDMLKLYSKTYNVSVTSLRYFSVYGTDQNPLNPYTGVLTIIGNQILNRKEISLNEDGTQERDLVHVEDVARAHFLATRKMVDGFKVFNICTGIAYSIKAVAEKLNDAFSVISGKEKLPIAFKGKVRKGDVYKIRGTRVGAKVGLGWEPFHELDQDILTYARFLYDKGHLYKDDTWEQEEQRTKGLMK